MDKCLYCGKEFDPESFELNFEKQKQALIGICVRQAAAYMSKRRQEAEEDMKGEADGKEDQDRV